MAKAINVLTAKAVKTREVGVADKQRYDSVVDWLRRSLLGLEENLLERSWLDKRGSWNPSRRTVWLLRVQDMRYASQAPTLLLLLEAGMWGKYAKVIRYGRRFDIRFGEPIHTVSSACTRTSSQVATRLATLVTAVKHWVEEEERIVAAEAARQENRRAMEEEENEEEDRQYEEEQEGGEDEGSATESEASDHEDDEEEEELVYKPRPRASRKRRG